ncbi:MAG: response regulator [bacterium]|nr:response regulator [bacterium]
MSKITLVVDDTFANRDFLERLMVQAGFDVRGASSGREALGLLEDVDDLALALIDMQLPDVNGLQLTYTLRQRYPDAYLIVATMHDERTLMESVFLKGGNVFLVKPHGFMELYKRLTTTDLKELRQGGFVVIDQYGPRPFSLDARA